MTVDLRGVQEFKADGRRSLDELYALYLNLEQQYGWIKETIFVFEIKQQRLSIKIPIFCFSTSQQGPALWSLAGIHGEEPAGPNALAESIDKLTDLGQKIPLVVIPLLNPLGYAKDWRYFNERRDWHKGQSVSDSEHHLPDLKDSAKPRASQPASVVAGAVIKFILKKIKDYSPMLAVDHHEDETLAQSYVCSQGFRGASDPAAQKAVDILLKSGIPIQQKGATRFGEQIKNGVVVDENSQAVKDGSIDEWLATEKIFVNDRWTSKPFAQTSLVIETPIINTPLSQRIEAHASIIKNYEKLWWLVYR